jgi:ligand-binding SRPBCC domain-containing protein
MNLKFESVLKASPETVWNWVSSGTKINKELSPILKMSSLADIKTEDMHKVVLGEPLGRSWLLLFGFIPIDYSDLTLIELYPGRGFVEESPMLSMKKWRHERTIEPFDDGSIIRDILTFEPRIFPGVCVRFVQLLFSNRHKVLVAEFS